MDTRRPNRSPRALVLGSLALLAVCACRSDSTTRDDLCGTGEPVETDGHRRLALVVGVGRYANPAVPDLAGPAGDARRFHALLTDPRTFAFPKENVCLLLDEQATVARFRAEFERTLTRRAREGDIAVLFFAGHGSQAWDESGDEPDEWDETLVLHDSRQGRVSDLSDDDLSGLLRDLLGKTQQVTAMLDSCNSGTATRGAMAFTPRFVPPADPTERAVRFGTGTDGWTGDDLPGLVVLTAASDGTPALERDGRGIFTDAVLRVLSQPGAQPPTYAQVARQVPPLVRAESPQIPYFQGLLNRAVFGASRATAPIGWEITDPGPPIALSGTPAAGFGPGAELLVYAGNAPVEASRDPARAKATLQVDKSTGVNATAHVVAARSDAQPITRGDVAILTRAARDYVGIRVRLRRAAEAGGIPAARADALRSAIRAHTEGGMLVSVVEAQPDFELALDRANRLVLRGADDRIRNRYANDASVPESLLQHARQRGLLQLHGEGGADFVDQQTLQIQLVPAATQLPCARGAWLQAEPNSEQLVPLCHSWNVAVQVSQRSGKPLLVGGVVLSSDGSSFGFPADGRAVMLRPGERAIFTGGQETFVAGPPLDARDMVLVFGTQETNPVPWHLLTQDTAARAATPQARSGLHGALERYLSAGTRGVTVTGAPADYTTWTMSSVSLRVEANARFAPPGAPNSLPSPREYTLANFDIRPYLPRDSASALHRVLDKADWLARSSVRDGFGYKQHEWAAASDAANLRKGIDCSRAIWFAFTRSGLPYNRDDDYLTTAQMMTANSAMRDEFDRCPAAETPRLGDILVYRSAQRGDGHVVMVIDAGKRIAWGSHGWDGNARDPVVEPDTGVEYQLIKYKPDWARWDRKDMELLGCWRYRRFTAAATGVAGDEALDISCEEGACPL